MHNTFSIRIHRVQKFSCSTLCSTEKKKKLPLEEEDENEEEEKQ